MAILGPIPTLGPIYMKLPTAEDNVRDLVHNFHGFPRCLDVIDSTHIEIKQSRANYFEFIIFGRSRQMTGKCT